MRFRYRVPVVGYFVVLLFVVSPGGGVPLWHAGAQPGVRFGGLDGPLAGISIVGLSLAVQPSEQSAVDRPPRQTLSSGRENVLLLLLGVALLLTFTAARVWSSKRGGEPTK